MCNAYGHPPGCNCGWGGSGSGGSRSGRWFGESTYNSNSNIISNNNITDYTSSIRRIKTNNGNFIFIADERIYSENEFKDLTFKTVCWHCGEEIYVYQNTHGSVVLFDNLGGSWPKHNCSGYESNPNRRFELPKQHKLKPTHNTLVVNGKSLLSNNREKKKELSKVEISTYKKPYFIPEGINPAFTYNPNQKNNIKNNKIAKKNIDVKNSIVSNDKSKEIKLGLINAHNICGILGVTIEESQLLEFCKISNNYKTLFNNIEKYVLFFKLNK